MSHISREDRVFLDANVLFSASFQASSTLRGLWDLPMSLMIASTFVVNEAWRNVRTDDHASRLETLLRRSEIVDPEIDSKHPLLSMIQLPPRDQPVLLGAIAVDATHLLTGDIDHFGPYFGRQFGRLKIERPGVYLAARRVEQEP